MAHGRRAAVSALTIVILVGIGAGVWWSLSEGDRKNSSSAQSSSAERVGERNESAQMRSPEGSPRETSGGSLEEERSGDRQPGVESVTVDDCLGHLSDACRKRAYTDEDFAIAVLKRKVKEDPQAQAYMNAVTREMPPFRFVGKVVGPGGNPIPNTEVEYRLGFPFSLGYMKSQTTTTNESGLFAIRGRAASLRFQALRKPGFEPAAGFKQSREFGNRERMGHIPWEQATAESPREFVLEPVPE